ncbi:hypothetical protein G9C98_006925 [Cotesia typhae]|uniref:Uncharacterized protein n=1 Tax=Cotesia typhae TaxID=2053667 RepID=A0A8J5V6D3_9HYME|nr:hypothetical protein G9C98_006925 [Cotesia typhae]
MRFLREKERKRLLRNTSRELKTVRSQHKGNSLRDRRINDIRKRIYVRWNCTRRIFLGREHDFTDSNGGNSSVPRK